MVDNGMEVFMVSSFADNICELERRESSKFFIVNMTRTITPIKDFFSLVRLVRILIKLKPSIVHTHTPKAGLIGMFSAWVTRVPIRLHTVAGLPLMEKQGPKRLLLEMVEKITYACASKIYPNSTSLKKFILKSNFCSPYKLKVIGNGSSNGINTKYFNENNTILKEADKIKKEFNITADNFVFIFIGRLVKDKGIEELVQAFSQLHKVFSQSRLLLVGSFEPELDPLSNNCLQVILNSKTIIHAGFQNDVRQSAGQDRRGSRAR